jgi:hypothetical protein
VVARDFVKGSITEEQFEQARDTTRKLIVLGHLAQKALLAGQVRTR